MPIDSTQKGGELDQQHIEQLLKTAEAQVKFAVTDLLRHACVHLGVDWDHPSKSVVLQEIEKRVEDLFLDGNF